MKPAEIRYVTNAPGAPYQNRREIDRGISLKLPGIPKLSFPETTGNSKVATRPNNSRCGVRRSSQLRGISASASTDQQRRDYGKRCPAVRRERRACLSRLKDTGQGPRQRIRLFHLQHHTHGAGKEQLDSRQHLGSIRSAATPTLTLPCSYLRTGVTTTAVVRRHEGKKPEDKRPGICSRRRTSPSAPSFVRSSTKKWSRYYGRLGTPWGHYTTIFTIFMREYISSE